MAEQRKPTTAKKEVEQTDSDVVRGLVKFLAKERAISEARLLELIKDADNEE